MCIASVKRKTLLKYIKQSSQLEMELEGVGSLGKQWTSHGKQVINPSSPWDLRRAQWGQWVFKRGQPRKPKDFLHPPPAPSSKKTQWEQPSPERMKQKLLLYEFLKHSNCSLFISVSPTEGLPNSRCSVNFCSIEFVVEGVNAARNRRYQTKSQWNSWKNGLLWSGKQNP